MAGENQHLVQPSAAHGPPTRLQSLMELWGKKRVTLTAHTGGGKSRVLLALLRAEQQRHRYEEVERTFSTALALAWNSAQDHWRNAEDNTEFRLLTVFALRMAVPPPQAAEGRALLPPVTSGSPALTPRARAMTYVSSPHGLLGMAVAIWSALHAGLGYWRRATAELRRLFSAPAVLSAEPADLVVLDSSPCGIRRLTAVRVPRAPGSRRTSAVPNSSLLAAA
ncbi:hypothetical protein [Streptomyces sp. W007]|uniref:hypothetical protein n=1 Tax=Streptomyces sp. W007 TaxID=1055352 RepID=UPI0011126F25|nr:hypothetical protein [Streptomyces sp. W007]